jgi:hypothetical protein
VYCSGPAASKQPSRGLFNTQGSGEEMKDLDKLRSSNLAGTQCSLLVLLRSDDEAGYQEKAGRVASKGD